MKKARKRKEPGKTNVPPRAELPSKRFTLIYFLLLACAAVVCFLPLLRYFFAQDDFVLMNGALRDGARTFLGFFDQKPGHFRPLTKGLYFSVMYKTFGLHAAPYHAVSILMHIINSILVYSLLKRCRAGSAASLVAATLFALSVAFFHVIGWVACIQQLLGQCFLLITLLFGVDYLRGGRERSLWVSLAAYVLALASLEQTFAAPVILLLFTRLNIGRWVDPPPLREALGKLSSHLAVMFIYLFFIAVYKKMPQEGTYAFAFGGNIVKNLSTYLGWSLHFGAILPFRINAGVDGLSRAHIVLAALVLYQLLMRRAGAVVFGLSYFVLAVFPALFMQNHTFYLHTYIAVFGILYLIAVAADDIFSMFVFRSGTVLYASLFVILAGISAVSFVMVRKNEQKRMYDITDYARSFVLRRAVIAKNVYDSLVDKKPFDENVKSVHMVYGREGGDDEAKWNNENVIAAIGMGSLVRLLYGKPDMPVVFRGFGDTAKRSELIAADVYFYDDVGNCRKLVLRDSPKEE